MTILDKYNSFNFEWIQKKDYISVQKKEKNNNLTNWVDR